MITQTEVFQYYQELAYNSSYREKGNFNYAEIDNGRMSDEKMIPTLIAMEVASKVAWDFGWIPIIQNKLIGQFGERLRPYLMELRDNPLHGGGTAYGDDYIAQMKQYVKTFCENSLSVLDNPK